MWKKNKPANEKENLQIPNNNHKPQLTIPLLTRNFPLAPTKIILIQHKRTTLPPPALAEIESIGCALINAQHATALGRAVDLKVRFDGGPAVDVSTADDDHDVVRGGEPVQQPGQGAGHIAYQPSDGPR